MSSNVIILSKRNIFKTQLYFSNQKLQKKHKKQLKVEQKQ